MMQPMDIKTQSFGKGLFGYKKTDVDQYVDTVYRAYDELFTENKNLRDERDRLNKTIEENRLKIFEFENGGEGGEDDAQKIRDAKKEAEKIIADARMAAAEILASAGKSADDAVTETAKDAKEETATSKFFSQATDNSSGDDDDVFVGEIEDNRKPNKVMIGDGEEEGSDDFEFL